MTERILDWRPNWDEKNENFLIRQLDCFATGGERPNIWRRKMIWLDQGQEGACTGFGTGNVLASTPHPHHDITNAVAREIYKIAQKNDEWEGEDYSGSSVNGAMKAAVILKRITEYRWCKTLGEVRHALSYHGPIVIGVNWYEGMFNTDKDGFVYVTGRVAGGHAIALVGYVSVEGKRYYRLENSWGPGWGDRGGCWIRESDLQRLLDEKGEFAFPKRIVR